jgi:hypothetical protein
MALAGLGRDHMPGESVIMAAALLGTLPLLLVLVVFGKQIVGGAIRGQAGRGQGQSPCSSAALLPPLFLPLLFWFGRRSVRTPFPPRRRL